MEGQNFGVQAYKWGLPGRGLVSIDLAVVLQRVMDSVSRSPRYGYVGLVKEICYVFSFCFSEGLFSLLAFAAFLDETIVQHRFVSFQRYAVETLHQVPAEKLSGDAMNVF